MDQPCDELMQNMVNSLPPAAKDVLDAEFIQTLKGPCGYTLFVDHRGEGHFLFSLNVDFFNIERNSQHNANMSYRIILCVCLNIPVNEHYKTENMYLAGIIPSPCQVRNLCLNSTCQRT